MKRNAALTGFIDRFQGILDVFDEIADSEEAEELNAEFEDAVFLLENVDPNDEDAKEEIEGALEEIDALCGDYARQMNGNPEGMEIVRQLEMAARMARQNLL